jgi:hypothetical protein
MKYYKQLIIVFGALLTINCVAQEVNYEMSEGAKIYCKVYGSYGLLTPGSFKGSSSNDNNDVNIVNVHKKGMGGGIRAGFGIGLILNEYLNVGIDGEYLLGNKITGEVNSVEGYLIKTHNITTYSHNVVSIIPNVVFKIIIFHHVLI